MKINVEVDLEEYLDDVFIGSEENNLEKIIKDEIKQEVLKVVKKDPRYKAYVNKKANDTVESLI